MTENSPLKVKFFNIVKEDFLILSNKFIKKLAQNDYIRNNESKNVKIEYEI